MGISGTHCGDMPGLQLPYLEDVDKLSSRSEYILYSSRLRAGTVGQQEPSRSVFTEQPEEWREMSLGMRWRLLDSRSATQWERPLASMIGSLGKLLL